jgi:predicted transcriptional regulator
MTTEIVPFRLEPHWKERLDAIAESRGMSRSHTVRVAITNFIKRHYQPQEGLVKTGDGKWVKVRYRIAVNNDIEFLDADIIGTEI